MASELSPDKHIKFKYGNKTEIYIHTYIIYLFTQGEIRGCLHDTGATSSSETQGQIVGTRKSCVFWHQSEARMAATVWNWSGKTLSPAGALLAVLYFSSCHIYFSTRLDFPSPPLSAPGSPRMGRLSHHDEFTPVPSHGSTFVYMIPTQKVMPARVAPA